MLRDEGIRKSAERCLRMLFICCKDEAIRGSEPSVGELGPTLFPWTCVFCCDMICGNCDGCCLPMGLTLFALPPLLLLLLLLW